MRIRPETNSAGEDPSEWPGVHVVGCFDGSKTPFEGTAFVGMDYVIPKTLSSGKSFVLDICVGALSSMPAEITF